MPDLKSEDIDEIVDRLEKKHIPKHKTENAPKKPAYNKIAGIAIIVIAAVIILFAADIDELQPIKDYIFNEEQPEQPTPLTPAELELYRFSDLITNSSVNVELWLINIGETAAKDIEIFVRVRNQNGTTLFSDKISPTVLLLRANETCSAVYTVPVHQDTQVTHTLEIEWAEGRTAYYKTTSL